jgi:hypothetical protein
VIGLTEHPPEAGTGLQQKATQNAIDALAAAELAESMDRVMRADDKLAAAHAEIKRLDAEIQVVTISRNGYRNGEVAITRLLESARRQVAALERKIENVGRMTTHG